MFQNAKLNKIESLRNTFETMLQCGASLTSLLADVSKQKSSSQTSTLSTSSFLSSTMIGNNNTTLNNLTSINTSMFMTMSPQGRYKEKQRFLPFAQQSTEESLHVHLLNQFLIDALKRLQFDFDHLIKLKKPVSIDFNENQANFAHLVATVNGLWEQRNTRWLAKSKHVDQLLQWSMEYLYEEREEKKRSGNIVSFRMPVCLEEPLRKCKEKNKEIKSLFLERIYKPYTNYLEQLERNKLIQLKRSFFIHFYNYDAEKINHIMEQLNAMTCNE